MRGPVFYEPRALIRWLRSASRTRVWPFRKLDTGHRPDTRALAPPRPLIIRAGSWSAFGPRDDEKRWQTTRHDE